MKLLSRCCRSEMDPSTKHIREDGKVQYKCKRCEIFCRPVDAQVLRKDILSILDRVFDENKPKNLKKDSARLKMLFGIYIETEQIRESNPKKHPLTLQSIEFHKGELDKIHEWIQHTCRMEDQLRFQGTWMREYRRTAREELKRLRSFAS